MEKYVKIYTRPVLRAKVAKLNRLDATACLKEEFSWSKEKSRKKYKLHGWGCTWEQLSCKEACAMVDVMILAAQNGKMHLDNMAAKATTLETQNIELKRTLKKLHKRLKEEPDNKPTKIVVENKIDKRVQVLNDLWTEALGQKHDAEAKVKKLEETIAELKEELKKQTPTLNASELHYSLINNKEVTIRWLWHMFEEGMLMEKHMGKVTRMLDQYKKEGGLSPVNHEDAVNILTTCYYHRIYNPPVITMVMR